jgi:hypothetical protein
MLTLPELGSRSTPLKKGSQMAHRFNGGRFGTITALSALLATLCTALVLARHQPDGHETRGDAPTLASVLGDIAPFGLFPGQSVRVCVPDVATRPALSELTWAIRFVTPDGETGPVKYVRIPQRGFRCVDVRYDELTREGHVPEPGGRLQVMARVVPVTNDRRRFVVSSALPDGSFQIFEGQTTAFITGRFGLKSSSLNDPGRP